MIKVIYVGGLSASEKGAVGTHTSGVISALEKRKNIHLSGIFYREALPSTLPADYDTFDDRRRRANSSGALAKILFFAKYSFFVFRVLKEKKFDYIYVRFDPFFCVLLSLFLPKGKMIVEYNDLFMEQIYFAAKRGQWTGLAKIIRLSFLYERFVFNSERLTFSKSFLVVAVTDPLLDYCRKRFPGLNGLVLKNATDLCFDEFILDDDFKQKKLIISHVGTLTYWDGLEELLQALCLAREKSETFNFELNIVGNGRMMDPLVELVRKLDLEHCVKFWGAVPREEAVSVLKKTDVVPILKTIVGYGLSPMKFYEALGAGCHVLASDVPHMNEDDDNFVVNVQFPLDVDEISDKFIFFHKNITLMRRDRVAIAKYAREHHSWDSRIELLARALT